MAKKDIKVDTIIAQPGQRAQGYLAVGEMQDGTEVRLPIAIINGIENGSVLYIQATSDGNELNGIGVIQEILRSIDPRQLRGGIIAVPLVNFYAFHAKQASNPVAVSPARQMVVPASASHTICFTQQSNRQIIALTCIKAELSP